MGEFWYDLERAAQINPGVCPIRAGKYSVHHALLDFKKISLQTFPFGRLRFIFKLIDNKNSLVNLMCLLIKVENHFN
ncbi:hypothetical protein ILUMI_10742 [Ignelater luminosus]|uniref:Uncharacterized protein n=1 Tax=Ignelater luminosus TaxID=2038154 RepID=A0A8K0CXA5_IGNLU|nr:hypothetical protein ILUMI_10742 [Ignelater luminosus]